jgi:hypothetical protein
VGSSTSLLRDENLISEWVAEWAFYVTGQWEHRLTAIQTKWLGLPAPHLSPECLLRPQDLPLVFEAQGSELLQRETELQVIRIVKEKDW